MDIDLELLLKAVKKIAVEAGAYIQNERDNFSIDKIEYKDINDLVSYVDKTSEKLIVSKLSALNIEAGFITEEGTTVQSDRKGLSWIVDPLDGTTNYLHKLPHYSVSIALAEGDKVLLGVVYDICRKTIFHASLSGGAFENDKRIYVSNTQTIQQSIFATGFPYVKFDKMNEFLEILESLMQKSHGLRRFGSAALDLAYVANGSYDGFYEHNLKSWDMAAGVLLVTEAGGKVCDFEGGQDHLFGGDIIAAGAVHKELLTEIKRFWI